MQETLQLSLFFTNDPRHTNYTALYDLAPRFIYDRTGDQRFLEKVTREFPFNNELYTVTVYPARITDADGEDFERLPGEREALVEDVLRRFAAEKLRLNANNEVTLDFTIYQISQELKKQKHTLSYTEIKEALSILNGSKIEIARVVEPGEKKPRPVVNASALPVLAYKDANNPDAGSFVQFNPLLVQAIKNLEFEQVNYAWMMRIRGALPRWIFKFASLALLPDSDDPSSAIELRAAELIKASGRSRSRQRDALADITAAIKKLKESGVIAEFHSQAVKNGKVKEDVRFTVRFSQEFMDDRRLSRSAARHRENEALRITGKARPGQFFPITRDQAADVRMRKQEVFQLAD
jgi:hypothetical protein